MSKKNENMLALVNNGVNNVPTPMNTSMPTMHQGGFAPTQMMPYHPEVNLPMSSNNSAFAKQMAETKAADQRFKSGLFWGLTGLTTAAILAGGTYVVINTIKNNNQLDPAQNLKVLIDSATTFVNSKLTSKSYEKIKVELLKSIESAKIDQQSSDTIVLNSAADKLYEVFERAKNVFDIREPHLKSIRDYLQVNRIEEFLTSLHSGKNKDYYDNLATEFSAVFNDLKNVRDSIDDGKDYAGALNNFITKYQAILEQKVQIDKKVYAYEELEKLIFIVSTSGVKNSIFRDILEGFNTKFAEVENWFSTLDLKVITEDLIVQKSKTLIESFNGIKEQISQRNDLVKNMEDLLRKIGIAIDDRLNELYKDGNKGLFGKYNIDPVTSASDNNVFSKLFIFKENASTQSFKENIQDFKNTLISIKQGNSHKNNNVVYETFKSAALKFKEFASRVEEKKNQIVSEKLALMAIVTQVDDWFKEEGIYKLDQTDGTLIAKLTNKFSATGSTPGLREVILDHIVNKVDKFQEEPEAIKEKTKNFKIEFNKFRQEKLDKSNAIAEIRDEIKKIKLAFDKEKEFKSDVIEKNKQEIYLVLVNEKEEDLKSHESLMNNSDFDKNKAIQLRDNIRLLKSSFEIELAKIKNNLEDFTKKQIKIFQPKALPSDPKVAITTKASAENYFASQITEYEVPVSNEAGYSIHVRNKLSANVKFSASESDGSLQLHIEYKCRISSTKEVVFANITKIFSVEDTTTPFKKFEFDHAGVDKVKFEPNTNEIYNNEYLSSLTTIHQIQNTLKPYSKGKYKLELNETTSGIRTTLGVLEGNVPGEKKDKLLLIEFGTPDSSTQHIKENEYFITNIVSNEGNNELEISYRISRKLNHHGSQVVKESDIQTFKVSFNDIILTNKNNDVTSKVKSKLQQMINSTTALKNSLDQERDKDDLIKRLLDAITEAQNQHDKLFDLNNESEKKKFIADCEKEITKLIGLIASVKEKKATKTAKHLQLQSLVDEATRISTPLDGIVADKAEQDLLKIAINKAKTNDIDVNDRTVTIEIIEAEINNINIAINGAKNSLAQKEQERIKLRNLMVEINNFIESATHPIIKDQIKKRAEDIIAKINTSLETTGTTNIILANEFETQTNAFQKLVLLYEKLLVKILSGKNTLTQIASFDTVNLKLGIWAKIKFELGKIKNDLNDAVNVPYTNPKNIDNLESQVNANQTKFEQLKAIFKTANEKLTEYKNFISLEYTPYVNGIILTREASIDTTEVEGLTHQDDGDLKHSLKTEFDTQDQKIKNDYGGDYSKEIVWINDVLVALKSKLEEVKLAKIKKDAKRIELLEIINEKKKILKTQFDKYILTDISTFKIKYQAAIDKAENIYNSHTAQTQENIQTALNNLKTETVIDTDGVNCKNEWEAIIATLKAKISDLRAWVESATKENFENPDDLDEKKRYSIADDTELKNDTDFSKSLLEFKGIGVDKPVIITSNKKDETFIGIQELHNELLKQLRSVLAKKKQKTVWRAEYVNEVKWLARYMDWVTNYSNFTGDEKSSMQSKFQEYSNNINDKFYNFAIKHYLVDYTKPDFIPFNDVRDDYITINQAKIDTYRHTLDSKLIHSEYQSELTYQKMIEKVRELKNEIILKKDKQLEEVINGFNTSMKHLEHLISMSSEYATSKNFLDSFNYSKTRLSTSFEEARIKSQANVIVELTDEVKQKFVCLVAKDDGSLTGTLLDDDAWGTDAKAFKTNYNARNNLEKATTEFVQKWGGEFSSHLSLLEVEGPAKILEEAQRKAREVYEADTATDTSVLSSALITFNSQSARALNKYNEMFGVIISKFQGEYRASSSYTSGLKEGRDKDSGVAEYLGLFRSVSSYDQGAEEIKKNNTYSNIHNILDTLTDKTPTFTQKFDARRNLLTLFSQAVTAAEAVKGNSYKVEFNCCISGKYKAWGKYSASRPTKESQDSHNAFMAYFKSSTTKITLDAPISDEQLIEMTNSLKNVTDHWKNNSGGHARRCYDSWKDPSLWCNGHDIQIY